MARTRLAVYMRDRLERLACELIKCPAEQKADERAYLVACKSVRILVEKEIPTKDAELLRRYGLAEPDTCIRLSAEDRTWFQQFHFRSKGEAPLSIRCRTFLATQKVIDAVNASLDAEKKHKEACKIKLNDYRALIRGVGYLEDVEAVWPEAAQIRDGIGGRAVSPLNPDVVQRIADDVATRIAA